MPDPTPFPIFRREADAAPGWETLAEEALLEHPYIRVDEVHVRTPSHPEGLAWTVAGRKNAVVIAPRLPDGRFLLIHQERYPIWRTLWEFPAGQIDDRDGADDAEVIVGTAQRELEEETGHRVAKGSLRSLGYYFSSQGFTDEHAYLFFADGVESVATGVDAAPLGEGGEAIHEARAFSSAELRQMIADNVIIDANTLAAYARMVAMGVVDA